MASLYICAWQRYLVKSSDIFKLPISMTWRKLQAGCFIWKIDISNGCIPSNVNFCPHVCKAKICLGGGRFFYFWMMVKSDWPEVTPPPQTKNWFSLEMIWLLLKNSANPIAHCNSWVRQKVQILRLHCDVNGLDTRKFPSIDQFFTWGKKLS